jgi:hypothetical protein
MPPASRLRFIDIGQSEMTILVDHACLQFFRDHRKCRRRQIAPAERRDHNWPERMSTSRSLPWRSPANISRALKQGMGINPRDLSKETQVRRMVLGDNDVQPPAQLAPCRIVRDAAKTDRRRSTSLEYTRSLCQDRRLSRRHRGRNPAASMRHAHARRITQL